MIAAGGGQAHLTPDSLVRPSDSHWRCSIPWHGKALLCLRLAPVVRILVKHLLFQSDHEAGCASDLLNDLAWMVLAARMPPVAQGALQPHQHMPAWCTQQRTPSRP